MAEFYIKIDEDTFVVWSTVTDAPVAWGTREALVNWAAESYAQRMREQLEEMMDRTEEVGWSTRAGDPFPLQVLNLGTIADADTLKKFVESYERIDDETERYDDSLVDLYEPPEA